MKLISRASCFLWLIFCPFWIQQNIYAGSNTLIVTNIELAGSQYASQRESELPGGKYRGLPKVLSEALNTRSITQAGIEQRVASSLQKIGKNLILESTRGPKEVAVYRKTAPAVLFVITDSVFGSGAIINKQGHVITNWHVVRNQPYPVVVFKPKDAAELKKELAFSAQVKKIDEMSDLALLEIIKPPNIIEFLSLADSSTLSVGQDVHAIGHPEGEIWTYTTGTISQIRNNYEWRIDEGFLHRAKIIQTQTPINPGSSGGPLLNDQGELIGINSFQMPGTGLNYAVSVDNIRSLLKKEESGELFSRPEAELRCDEIYESAWKRAAFIQACYLLRNTPPPDLWVVYNSLDSPASYAALDSRGTGHLDTVILSEEEKWQILWYFMDLDCDGIVDLIGHQFAGEEEIDSYQKPVKKLSIATMAEDIDAAIKRKKIPYPKLMICQ